MTIAQHHCLSMMDRLLSRDPVQSAVADLFPAPALARALVELSPTRVSRRRNGRR